MAEIEIFTAPDCDYCAAAKVLLEERGLPYNERNIGEDPGAKAALIERLPRVKTVPQIFVGDEHVGGFEDLKIWAADGRLDTSLEQ